MFIRLFRDSRYIIETVWKLADLPFFLPPGADLPAGHLIVDGREGGLCTVNSYGYVPMLAMSSWVL